MSGKLDQERSRSSGRLRKGAKKGSLLSNCNGNNMQEEEEETDIEEKRLAKVNASVRSDLHLSRRRIVEVTLMLLVAYLLVNSLFGYSILFALTNAVLGLFACVYYIIEAVYMILYYLLILPVSILISYISSGGSISSSQFKDQVIIITGASSGIGESLTLQLCGQGSHVILAARRKDRLDQIASKCTSLGAASAITIEYDASIESDANKLVSEAINAFNRIDMLILNAGIGGSWSRFSDLSSTKDLRDVMDVNYFGYVNLLHAAYPVLKQNKGRIVVISSFYDSIISPFQGGYAASKHALQGFFNTVRQEFKEDGVSVTMHSPGGVLTEVQHKFKDSSGRSTSLEVPDIFLSSSKDCASSILHHAYYRIDQVHFPYYASFMTNLRRLFMERFDFLFHKLVNFYFDVGVMKLKFNN